MPVLDALQTRQRLIDSLVAQVATAVFADTGQVIDQTRLEGIIDAWLPQTYAEAEAETQRLRQQNCRLWINHAESILRRY